MVRSLEVCTYVQIEVLTRMIMINGEVFVVSVSAKTFWVITVSPYHRINVSGVGTTSSVQSRHGHTVCDSDKESLSMVVPWDLRILLALLSTLQDLEATSFHSWGLQKLLCGHSWFLKQPEHLALEFTGRPFA